MWNAYIAPAPFNSSQLETVLKSEVSKMWSQQQGRRSQGSAPRSQGSAPNQTPSKRQKVPLTKDDFCSIFNTTKAPPFCPNPTAPAGCLGNDGKVRKHSCNAKLPGGRQFCNSGGNNYFTQ